MTDPFNKPKLFLTLSTGWGIRNFIYTGLLDRLNETYEVTIYAIREDAPELIHWCKTRGGTLRKLHNFKEPFAWRLVRQLRKKAFQSKHRIRTEEIRAQEKTWRSLNRRFAAQTIGLLSPILGWQPVLDLFGELTYRPHLNLYQDDFERDRPALLLVGSPFSYLDGIFVREALRAGIKTAATIPSWDNLSSKGMIWQGYDRVFVWSEFQKKEIAEYYPNYRPEQVTVTGVPQFDIYAQDLPAEFQRKPFLEALGIASHARVLLYTTNGPRTAPEEVVVIGHLLEAIEQGQLPQDLHLLLRLHPYDDSSRYETMRIHPRVTLWENSRKEEENLYNWAPPKEELYHLAATLGACHLVITVASTTTLDASASGKPVINICYDGDKTNPFITSVHRYYEFTHYKPVVDSGAVYLVKSQQELINTVNFILENPDEKKAEREHLLKTLCGYFPGSAVDRLATGLKGMATEVGTDYEASHFEEAF